MCNHHFRMCLEPRLYPSGLPLPEDHVPLPVTTTDPLSVRRKTDLTGVPSDRVPSEPLVPCLAEVIGAVYEDLIVQGLGSKVFLARMKGHSGHRVHIRLGDVFDCDRDVEIPGANCLVIGRGNKPPILVYESDCVDRPQMLVILLRYFTRPDVVLHNLFVRHARHKNILLIVIGVEPNHIRYLSVAKAVETLTGLGIPEFHLPVISAGQELAAVVRERKVFDGLYVSMKRPHAVPVSVNVPQLEGSVWRSRTPVSWLNSP